MMTTTFSKPALGRCPHCDAGKARVMETSFDGQQQRNVSKFVHLRGEHGQGFVDCAIQDLIARDSRGK